MHIPSGYLWNEDLVFKKKSQGVAWLNSLPVTDDGVFDPPITFSLNYSKIGKLPKAFRERHLQILAKFFIIEKMFQLTDRQKDARFIELRRSQLYSVHRAEFDIVPIKASKIFLTTTSVKEEPDE
jgi:hypothetical protein